MNPLNAKNLVDSLQALLSEYKLAIAEEDRLSEISRRAALAQSEQIDYRMSMKRLINATADVLVHLGIPWADIAAFAPDQARSFDEDEAHVLLTREVPL